MNKKGYNPLRKMIPIGWGARLDETMREKDMNYNELGMRCGISRKTLYAWVEMNASPRIDDLCKVVDVLNISLDWLMFGRRR